jgi:hypothetical protein
MREASSVSEREYKLYDVFVYHDLDSYVEPRHGMNGSELGFDEDRTVVAIGRPIHEGRAATVILGGLAPMPEMQEFLDALR